MIWWSDGNDRETRSRPSGPTLIVGRPGRELARDQEVLGAAVQVGLVLGDLDDQHGLFLGQLADVDSDDSMRVRLVVA